jgi:hypothetical protein
MAACLVLAACGSPTATTPVTTDVPIPTAAATATPTPAPTATAVATATPAATELATATPVPAATATPAASAAADRGAGCSGTQQFKDLFAAAAADLSFDVYCAVLPGDYWVHAGNYTPPGGGVLDVDYRNGRGFEIELTEGYFCSSEDCVPPTNPDARILFGDLGADLYVFEEPVADPALVGPATVSVPITRNIAWVDMGHGLVYAMAGIGMSKGTFANLAQAVIKVPKA